jgi:hypothetical protein
MVVSKLAGHLYARAVPGEERPHVQRCEERVHLDCVSESALLRPSRDDTHAA